MQQPISRRDVYEPHFSAQISGREVEIVDGSVTRALPDPLKRNGLRAATGRITALEGPDVTETVATPWDPGAQWPPVPQASASLSIDTGAGEVSILRDGRVIAAEAASTGREVFVEVADQYQSLDKTISWGNLAALMPLAAEAQGDRYVGLQSVALTDRILRHCGWYATPPQISATHTLLSVPAMGTMWPEKGRVDSSYREDGGGYPYWDTTPWGIGVQSVEASYRLAGGEYTLQGRGRIEMTAMTTPGTAQFHVLVSGAGILRLAWTANNGTISVRDPEGSYAAVASVPRTDGLLYATVEYVSASEVRCIIRSGGQVTTVTAPAHSLVTTGSPTTATISVGTGAAASGFQVAMPAQPGTLTSWTSNVNMRPRTSNRNTLRVVRAIESESCVDLLAQQCEAECATYWIDETGVLQWWDLARLESQPSVGELNSADDIAEAGFSWSHDLSQVKSRVLVRWREPLSERRWRTAVDLWQGSAKTLAPGDAPSSNPVEEWIHVPDDEVWIAPDLTLSRVGDVYTDFNQGLFSWYGGIVDRDDGEESWAQLYGSLLVTIERVTDSAFKMFTVWTGDRTMTQRTFSEYRETGLWARRMNFDLPIIRGRAKYVFDDRETHSTQSGPASAPEHVIDAGWWIQDEAQAQYTADYAGARLTVAQPVLSSVALIPLPGLQLGDVVTVMDTHQTRLTIRGVVESNDIDDPEDMDMVQAISIRPTYITRNGVTWEQWGQVMAGRSWETWGAQQAGKTWQDWGAAPLLGEDVL